MKLDAKQQQAIEQSRRIGYTLVTGGAGTGKTTVIRDIAERLEADGEKVEICAFAGKAAARIKEATGHDASTIHRMLGWRGVKFSRGYLDRISVICDESSMVPSPLLAEICKRNPERIILVGDEAQLPPVGVGQPFFDLIKLYPERVVRLDICHRATEAIHQAANLVRAGQMPPMSASSPNENWEIENTGDAERTQAYLLELVKAKTLDYSQDIIIAPRNGDNAEEPCCVNSLNHLIASIVNPRRDERKIQPGDRVICTKNCPELDIWNGTTGTATAIDASGRLHFQPDYPVSSRDGKTTDVDVPSDVARNFELAYALTIHKAQGSQYRRVIVVCLMRDAAVMLSRPMLYTAATRARQTCQIVGQSAAFANGIRKLEPKRTVLYVLGRLRSRNA